jgi:hypothetical protein
VLKKTESICYCRFDNYFARHKHVRLESKTREYLKQAPCIWFNSSFDNRLQYALVMLSFDRAQVLMWLPVHNIPKVWKGFDPTSLCIAIHAPFLCSTEPLHNCGQESLYICAGQGTTDVSLIIN